MLSQPLDIATRLRHAMLQAFLISISAPHNDVTHRVAIYQHAAPDLPFAKESSPNHGEAGLPPHMGMQFRMHEPASETQQVGRKMTFRWEEIEQRFANLATAGLA